MENNSAKGMIVIKGVPASPGIAMGKAYVLEDEEIVTPTALQEGVIPTLRRGGNLVARASSGSGKTLAA